MFKINIKETNKQLINYILLKEYYKFKNTFLKKAFN